MTISERIFEKLGETGMSQKEFALKAGIAPSTVSDWKKKKLNPSADRIPAICEALGITPDELLSGQESSAERLFIEKGSDEYELIMRYRSVEEAQKKRILGYMEALQDMG